MALTETVENLNVGDRIEFSAERRVRKKLVQSRRIVSEFVCYEAGQDTVLHVHPEQDEIFFVIEGRGAITFGDRDIPVEPKSLVFVPAGTHHGVRADGDSRLVVMFTKGPGTPPRPPRH